MTGAAVTRRMTAQEYLQWERAQPDKHEFHAGEVYLMAGGSLRHSFLAGAVVAELRAALRGKGCHVMTSDQRIAAPIAKRYVYADAAVPCGEVRTDPEASDVLVNPSIVVEVLSQSTETYDRGDKWTAYQQLGSLTDYLLVAQSAVRIEHYQREAAGAWRYRVLQSGGTVTFSNGASLSVDAIYEGAFDLPGD